MADACAREVKPGDAVTLHYRLATPDEREIVSTFGAEPVQLRLGSGDLHPNLERRIIGLAPGMRKAFFLSSAEAFGPTDPQLEQKIPLEAFPPSMALEENALIEFTLPNGTAVAGILKGKTTTHALVDFNHPLSGCDVVFEVEVVETRRGE